MRKTTEYNTENRLTVDIEGLMAMLSCGAVTARKIADCAEAKIIVGRRVLYNVDKIKKYLDAMVLFGKLNAAVSIRLKRVFQST